MKPEQADNLQVQLLSISALASELAEQIEELKIQLATYSKGDKKIASIIETVLRDQRVGHKSTWVTKDHKAKYVSTRRITYKVVRIVTGLTIREIAHSMGVDYSTISLALRILTEEEERTAKRIADIFLYQKAA